MAGRVPRRSLRASVLIEQAAVLGFGLVMGVAAGIASAALVVRNLPEFPSPPPAPPLLFSPPVISVLVVLAAAAVLLAVPAVVSAAALIRSARPELLREVPQ
jgi:ABC-type antimicrobial peptide transport system permease subunit